MKKLLSLFLALAMSLGVCSMFTACGGETYSVGLLALHDENSTYDKNFIDAFKAACNKLGVTDYTIITGVPEEEDCYNQAVKLASKGCKAIFADSFSHEAYMLRAAKEFTDVQFCHATGVMAHTENLSNFHNAFASIYEGRYLAGVAAGLKLQEMIDNNTLPATAKKEGENYILGYVGAKPYAEVKSGYTAWYLGVKSVVSNVVMKVKFTGEWYDEAGEKSAAEALINLGAAIVSQHADSWGAPTACETAGVPNVSYNGSTASKCGNTFIVSSKINWQPYFELMIKSAVLNDGTVIPEDYFGSIGTGSVELTEFGTAAAVGTQEKINEVKAQLVNGTLKVFDCSKFTVDGAAVTSYMADVNYDEAYKGDTEAIKTEGTVTFFDESGEGKRSAPYFDLDIDGIDIIA